MDEHEVNLGSYFEMDDKGSAKEENEYTVNKGRHSLSTEVTSAKIGVVVFMCFSRAYAIDRGTEKHTGFENLCNVAQQVKEMQETLAICLPNYG